MRFIDYLKERASVQFMLMKQRERVCEAVKAYVDKCDEWNTLNCYNQWRHLKKEIRKLRALEGNNEQG